jgi:EmrB/QacA subfamily drug resistance transporter
MDNSLDKRFVLIIASLPNFLFPFMSTAMNVALPTMSIDLSLDAILLGWVVTAYQLASVILVLPFGRLADIYGRKKIMTAGMFLSAATCLALMFANSSVELISFRIFQGIGGIMSYTTGMTILISAFPQGQRGKALGFLSAAAYAGQSAGPFAGGLLTHYFGWRSIFLVGVILSLITVVFIFWKLKGEWIESKGEKLDIIGTAILGFTLFSIVYGLSSLPDTLGILLVGIGIVGLISFIFYELKVENPIMNMELFRKNRVFAFSSVAVLINFGATWPVALLLSLYLQYIKGFDPQTAGFVLVTQPVIQVLCSPIAGRISDKIEPRIVASIAMALTTIGLVMFAFLDNGTSLAYIISALVLAGIGFAFFGAPNSNAIMNSVDKKFYGVSSAIISMMRQLGVIFGMGTIMMLFSIYMGRVQITPEYYEVFLTIVKLGFTISATLCFVGIFASLSRGKANHQSV